MAQVSTATATLPVSSQEPTAIPQRLMSLDVFRGATMALMVLVNDPGGPVSYPPLEHSRWDGWTPTDVVFPSFLWIVGVAMTLSLGKRMAAGVSRGKLFAQILRRSIVLYVLGLIVYAYPFNLHTQRLLGVLQRIAICYLVAGCIYLTTRLRGQIIWIGSLLAVYWVLMMMVPVPGYGAGHLDVQSNFAHYIDSIVLGSHNYRPTRTWDPEGIISTLPAIATALFGIMAGHILRLRRTLEERTTWLFLAGNALMAAGVILNAWMPINKKLWSDSFSLFMAGLDFVMFAMSLWLIDGRGYKRFTKPLAIMGMNAIAVYMVSELLAEALEVVRWQSGGETVSLHGWLYQHLFAWYASPANASLLFALAYVLLMYALAYGMYRRNWFVRV
jgi:predicted acyltransferase